MDNAPALTVAQFCRNNGISPAFYYKLKSRGLGPREMRIGNAVRISPWAEKEWRLERETLQQDVPKPDPPVFD